MWSDQAYAALDKRLPTLIDNILAIDAEEGLGLTVQSVGEELVKLLQLPVAKRPDYLFVDGKAKGADAIAQAIGTAQARFVRRLGFGDLLPDRELGEGAAICNANRSSA